MLHVPAGQGPDPARSTTHRRGTEHPQRGARSSKYSPGKKRMKCLTQFFSVPPGHPGGLNKVWGPRTRHLQPKRGQTGPKKVPGPHAATPNRADPPAAHENNS